MEGTAGGRRRRKACLLPCDHERRKNLDMGLLSLCLPTATLFLLLDKAENCREEGRMVPVILVNMSAAVQKKERKRQRRKKKSSC